MKYKRYLAIGFAVFLFGCGGPLMVKYSTKGAPPINISSPHSIHVKPYKDLRGLTDPHTVGAISATVSGIFSNELVLDKDPSVLVTLAFKEELKKSGVNVIENEQGADYVLEGEIREFMLNIGARDEIAIEVFMKLKDPSGNIVWEGIKKEKKDRYAGVMGNSRKTIEDYLVNTLSIAVKDTLTDIKPFIEPASLKTPLIEGDTGALTITTTPERAKVYIDDVYYGMSPITIELPSGIYTLKFVIKGFKEETEKVAIRKGAVTPVEVGFSKE